MPPRKTTSKGITIGFYGKGEMDSAAADKLITDFLASVEAKPRFVFPLTTEYATPNMKTLIDFAVDEEIAFDLVHDADAAANKRLKPYIDAATTAHKVTAVDAKLIEILAGSDQPSLFIFWDDDPATETVINEAVGKDIDPRDLTAGLDRLEIEADEPAADDEEEEEPEAPAEDGGDGEYTEAELREMGRTELKAVAQQYGITIPRGADETALTAVIDQILAAMNDTGADDDEDETEDDPEPTLDTPADEDDSVDLADHLPGGADPDALDDLIAHYEHLLSHLRQLKAYSSPSAPIRITPSAAVKEAVAAAEEAEAPTRRRRRTKAEMEAARAAEVPQEETAPSTGVRRGRRRTA